MIEDFRKGGEAGDVLYVDVAPAELTQIIVEALRRDLLSQRQVALVLDAAAGSSMRQEQGAPARH